VTNTYSSRDVFKASKTTLPYIRSTQFVTKIRLAKNTEDANDKRVELTATHEQFDHIKQ